MRALSKPPQIFSRSHASKHLGDKHRKPGTYFHRIDNIKRNNDSLLITTNQFVAGQVQLWRSAEQDKMSSAEFNGYRIQDVDLHDSLVYTQLTHRTGRQCLIKVLDTDADLKVVDTISIRGADEKYSLPKVIRHLNQLSLLYTTITNSYQNIANFLTNLFPLELTTYILVSSNFRK